ncbi:hypothetical protein [Desulfuribacillus alkaliarsenatis]|uniref:Uncharacterized protein n=1 Tax=Desulfuribacillus alkaliarsenatis TaxID=766136 RepID=A0A1E5G1G5_9FIRM|nr:hypothetical protein [Desulfuribacillus alkaliarsenatis]OEF96735.1 hypothetical protein BHF68_06590 [Desulfuribacillus alkaliarsenatis]
MRLKGIFIGMFVVIGLTAIIYYIERGPDHSAVFDGELLVIEDSVYDTLSGAEIEQMQNFAIRAINAADGEPAIYSPHAKYLDNGAILAYMMFVNNTGETVTELHSISVKLISGNNQTVAGGIFPSVTNMPAIAPDNLFLFSLIFQPEAVRQQEADLASYFTETFFEYTSQ